MPAFFRENLPYKLAALLFAVLLHFYVANQQAPARVMTVPLAIDNLPGNLLLGDDTPRQVMLTLNGPPDELDRLTAVNVSAYVDLAHVSAGHSVIVPVLVRSPDTVQVDPSPSMVTLALMPRETRRVPVTAADPGYVLPGYRYQAPRISPREVTVSGSQEAVDSIARVVANADASTSMGTINGDFAVVALDAQGSQVQDVTITPSRAHVVISMVSQPSVRNALVSADITGALPLNMQITGVEVHPRLIVVSGSPSRLAQITSIGTDPVDIAGATGTVTQTVNCVAPPGVTFPGASAVQVIVHVAPQSQPLAAAPASGTVTPASPVPVSPVPPGPAPAQSSPSP